MRSRLTSSRFIGRIGELAELRLAAREAMSGRPGLVLLGGDSGVGKTRLVSELEAALRGEDQPVLVLRGEGVEPADGELPYAPLLSALRPLVRERHPALDALAPGSRSQLASILPSLDSGAPREERADAAGQMRLFEAMLELLDLAGDQSPVVLILEDMHWADRSTRAFVAFLARSLRHERLLVLLSYRADELHRRHPMRPLLTELERLERARRIDLEPFDRDELGEALADILGAQPEAPMLERLYARSEGNPLYTEELLAAGLDGRGTAPQSLRDAFLVRVERLSAEAQVVARAASIGRLDADGLQVICAISPETLNAALRETVAEQILAPGALGRFGFRHALLREALYDDLLPGERAELHLALARHLEATAGPASDELDHAANVAGHYAAAGDQPAALRTTVRAGIAAERGLAYGEAADLFERALELWPRVADAQAQAGCDHVTLLSGVARAHWFAGDRARGEVLIREALRELDPEREPVRYAGLLERLARTVWSLNRGEEAVATGERALAMLPDGDPELRPTLLAWLARTQFLRGHFREAIRDGEVALQAAGAAGNASAQSEVLNTLGMAKAVLGDVEVGVGLLREAITVAGANDDPDGVTSAYSNLADMLNTVGRTADGLVTAFEGLAVTPRRLPRSYDWMNLTISELAFAAGDWATARKHLALGVTRPLGQFVMSRAEREAELALGEGDLELAQAALRTAEPLVAVSAEPQWIGTFGSLQGELRRRQRDFAGARASVEAALDRLELCTDDVMRIARVSVVGARVEADRAQRARDLRESGELRDTLARLRIHVQRLDAAAQEGGPVERAYHLEGRAELARAAARGRRPAPAWERTAEAWEAVGRPYPAAIARWREADALVVAGDRSAAAGVAAGALAVAERIGSRWLAQEIRLLAERARLPVGASVGRARSAEGDGDGGAKAATGEDRDPFGLTPRERQVLALLAEGATNRKIGELLFMAEKTASVHVSRILAKLGVSGRTQAATVAHRHHLI